MEIWTKPIYIKFRVRTLLIFLVILGILITGVVLYKNFVFHNLFFQNLSIDDIESIEIYHNVRLGETAVLSTQDAEAVISLLRNIRLEEEPYSDYGVIGGHGNDFHIKLKNGIRFDLQLAGGDPGVYIFNGDGYSIGYRDDPDTAEKFKNIWRLDALYEELADKYFPKET